MFVRSAGRGVHAGEYGILGSNQIIHSMAIVGIWRYGKSVKKSLIVNFDGEDQVGMGFLQSIVTKITQFTPLIVGEGRFQG